MAPNTDSHHEDPIKEQIVRTSSLKHPLFEQRLQQARAALRQSLRVIPRRQDHGPAPLSFAQQRLWFVQQLDPETPIYNRPVALRLLGPLNLSILEKSLNEIIRRHAILRSTYQIVQGTPIQQAQDFVPLPLPVKDFSNILENEKLPSAQAAMQQFALQVFNLEQGPLYRWQLFRLKEHDHILLFVTHHIAFDGWSEKIFHYELQAIYTALWSGQTPELPELPIQYADYAAWQHSELQNQDVEKGIHYWKERLAGPLPVFELPISRPRPARQTFRGATHTFTLPPSLTTQLKTLNRQENTTLFMLSLAVFAVLLYRYSGQEDILIGTPIAVRNLPELEPLIGCLLNNLVIRCDLSGEPTFQAFLQRIRQACLEAYTHQDTPFEKLVEIIQPVRDPGRTPVFQVMFNMKNFPAQHASGGSLVIEPFPIEMGVAHYDLSLDLVEREDEITGSLRYSTDLFDQDSMERMAGHYVTLLEQALSHPETPISQLSILTDAERRQILVDWNKTEADYPTNLCVHEAFTAQVNKSPNALALVSGNKMFSFAELNRRANQLAYELRACGVRPDSLVGLMVDRSEDMVIGILGILKAGGAYLPLDPNYPAERLAFMMQDAGIEVLLTQQRLIGDRRESPGQAELETSLGEVRNAQTATSQVASLIRRVILLDADWEAIARQPVENPERNAGPENLMYVIYTSGSTGKPKGVMVNHRSVLNLATALRKAIYAHLPDRQLRIGLNAPLSFDAFVQQFLPLVMGHTLYVVPQEARHDGHALLNFLRTHRLDVLGCVPTQLKLLLQAGLLEKEAWQPLAVLSGGEALDESTWRIMAKAEQIEFFNMYGPTECTVDSLIARVKDRPDRPVIGRAVTNARLYVLDAHQQPVPVGVPGELYIGGAGVARGYLNRPELTAEKFIPYPLSLRPYMRFPDGKDEKLYRSGDLVRWLSDGNIEFLGRIDRQVKIRGYRIELGEIEEALRQHPLVHQAIVQDCQDAFGDKRLVGYVVPVPTNNLTQPELRQFLKQYLPDYMIPSSFVFLDTLPLTPSGKIDRRALPPPEATSFQPEANIQAPRTPLEQALAKIWAETLGLGSLGIEDNFFSLGGHSLMAIRVISRIRDIFPMELPVSVLFDHPSVAGLALAMEQKSNDPQSLAQIAELYLSLEKLSEAELEEMLKKQTTTQDGSLGE